MGVVRNTVDTEMDFEQRDWVDRVTLVNQYDILTMRVGLGVGKTEEARSRVTE